MPPSERPAQPPRRRTARGEGGRLRSEIVTAAHDLLVETGSADAITLRAVARGAGIAAPSIYSHFDNAQQILLAVVVEQFEVLERTLQEAVASAPDEPLTRLLAWTSTYLDYAARWPQHYLVMFGGVWAAAPAVERHEIDLADVEALGADLINLLAGLLAACADSGISTARDPHGDASLLWVGLHGLAQQRIASPAFTWRSDAAEQLVHRLALLEAGAAPPGTPSSGSGD